MTVLKVGEGQQYRTIGAAIAATHDGDTVLVQAGVYLNDFAIIRTKITIASVGGLAVLQATESPPNGKAILTTTTDVTIDGLGFTGAEVSDQNGAGIRYEGGNLVVRNSVFWSNQEGILAGGYPNGTITIQNSEFSHNGAGDGYSHNLYVGAVKSLLIDNSYFHDAVGGHEVKSRAYSTTIINSRIMTNAGDSSYNIDLPNGGVNVITNNVIEKGPNAPNYTTVHFGGEGPPYAGSSLFMSGNTIVNDNSNGFLLNNAANAPVVMKNNSIWGYAADHVLQGGAATVTSSGTTVLGARPVLDLTSVAPTVVYTPAPPTIEVPPDSAYVTFGEQGAVLATGHILTVGANGQFKTLSSALAASRDGDTIQVAAGTYVNDIGQSNHKVIIEGVGGIARFVRNSTYGQAGILTVNNDVTIRNMEFSGGHGGGNSHEAGVTVRAGNATIVNSSFHDNDIGIYTYGTGPGITLSVYRSEIYRNGNDAKGTHNIAVGGIGSFTLKDSYVHDAVTGHEISARAYNTVIENNRILDGSVVNASFGIGLGQGGNAVIRNNVIEKGLHSVNDNLVFVGGEGKLYDNTNVRIDNNTLVSNMVWPDHPYTYFLSATSDVAAVGPITASNNTFVGGIRGSAQTVNVAGTGSRVATSAVLDTSSPVSRTVSERMVRQGSGLNTLTVTLSEVRDNLDAQFYVTVDGESVGGGMVTAATGTGTQSFTFKGYWPTGAHTVAIKAVNLYDGHSDLVNTAANALTIHSVSLDGYQVSPNKQLGSGETSWSTTMLGTFKLPGFDAEYYLRTYADVRKASVDPLIHYLVSGASEGRNPNAVFDTQYYLSHNADVAQAGINPLLHYELHGWSEGREPSVLFDGTTYFAAHPEADQKVDPMLTYLKSGDTRSYANPLIDPNFYHNAYADVAATRQAVTTDYISTGWQLGLDPSAWFNTRYYLWANPDVAAAKVNPLLHYEASGWAEGRNTNPWFSTSAYVAAHPEAGKTGFDPLISFLSSKEATASPISNPYMTAEAKAFDPGYYLLRNPDVARAHVDPLFHFEQYGWREGRNASATFDTNKYLTAYADVKNAQVDPLGHYVTYGIGEGRQAFVV